VERSAAVSQAEFDYETSLADLKRIQAGARPQELAQAEQATVQAKVARNRAEAELKRDQALATEGFVARRQLDDAQAAYDTASSALTSVEANESLLRAGSRPEERTAAELKAAAARAALANARLVGDQHVRQAEAALDQAKKSKVGLEAKAQDAAAFESLAKQRISESATAAVTSALGDIRAPYAGHITRRWLSKGDYADTNTAVLEIASADPRVDFVASVPAADAQSIRPGMKAELDAVGDAKSPGRVLSVSPADLSTGLCSVRIATSSRAGSGMFAHGRIILSLVTNAVAAPQAAVLDRDGKDVVFLVDGDTAKMVEIKAGAQDAGYIQVTSGLKAGDILVRLGQFELTDGAKVKVAERKTADKGDKP
jgi:HlyD family secretion protein